MSNLSTVTLFTDGKVVPIFLAWDPGRGSIQRWSHLVIGCAFCPDVWPCARVAALKDCKGNGNFGSGSNRRTSTTVVNTMQCLHNAVDFDETLGRDAPEVICQKYRGQSGKYI